MINKNTTVPVTILVPIGDIEILGANIAHEKESRDCPESWDVTYDSKNPCDIIRIEGLHEDFEITEFDDSIIDELALLRWNAGEL